MSMVSIGASCKTRHEHHRTKELCKKDVIPPQPFLDIVHLFALEILNLISDHVIAYLTYLMTLFLYVFIAFSMCESELLNHRNSFIEGNLSEGCIETCSVCLRLFVNVFCFFCFEQF